MIQDISYILRTCLAFSFPFINALKIILLPILTCFLLLKESGDLASPSAESREEMVYILSLTALVGVLFLCLCLSAHPYSLPITYIHRYPTYKTPQKFYCNPD